MSLLSFSFCLFDLIENKFIKNCSPSSCSIKSLFIFSNKYFGVSEPVIADIIFDIFDFVNLIGDSW